MNGVTERDQRIAVGENFLGALTTRDFDRLEACFQPNISFRALVPSGIREGGTAKETGAWLRRWFDDADEFQVLHSSVEPMADRVHITYQFRLRKGVEWQRIEQQVYCVVDEGLIAVMNLLCSGFRPEPAIQRELRQ